MPAFWAMSRESNVSHFGGIAMNRKNIFMAAICSLAATAGAWGGSAPQLCRLFPNSTLSEEFCLPPCACPYHVFNGPLGGSFFITLDHSDPLFDYYRLSGINWVGNLSSGAGVHLTGSGTYRIGGEVAVVQQMELDLVVNGTTPVHADSGVVSASQTQFPWINITVTSDQFVCNRLTMNLSTRPNFCVADLNDNGGVTLDDLTLLLSHFGTVSGATHEDGEIDGDGD